MNELQDLLKRAYVDEDTGAYAELSKKLEGLEEAHKLQERTDYMLGQALRVAREYKAKLERCEALAARSPERSPDAAGDAS